MLDFVLRFLASLGGSFIVAFSFAGSALAQVNPAHSPVGRWQTIDDKTGQPRAIVRIYEVNGTLQGDIEKVFWRADENVKSRCELCPAPQQGKEMIGLTILWALIPSYRSERSAGFEKGHILDPANATVYKCKMTLEDGGKRLAVRGFVGITGAIGRTQTWHRVS